MRNYIFAIVGILVIGGVIFFYSNGKPSIPSVNKSLQTEQLSRENSEAVSVIAEGLDTPWAIAFLPDWSMLVTEKAGRVRLVDQNGKLNQTPVAELSSVKEIGEGGLLGIALHPDFGSNNLVYFYYTYSGSGENTQNRVVAMVYKDKKLTGEKIIVDNIPGATNHNGGRIKFGPDGNLYIGTGDAQEPSRAQDKQSLAGKILRVGDDGQAAVFSWGHRNVQGLAWDDTGSLWATEHGRSGIQSGLDELNLIEEGKNYGWPEIQGDETRDGMETAKRNSGSTTWAPSGMAYVGSSLFFSGLRGQALYEAVIEDNQVVDFHEHLSGQSGRIREVIVGPDKMLYITTSNRDGRGNPVSNDDKIIKLDLSKL